MFKKVSKFIAEVRQELKKVNWSTRRELFEATTVVIISISILTGITWVIDLVYSHAMRMLLQ